MVAVWGRGRVGVHFAPRADAHDMGDSDLAATFGHVAPEFGRRRIAFLCARESESGVRLGPALKDAFGSVYIANEGFTQASATRALAAGEADAVAFGKLFIANPTCRAALPAARLSTLGTMPPSVRRALPATRLPGARGGGGGV
jgi:2,4-dienoyl-CoA reductase-like NADH-dependent reductase (Old Yellow Enzyme family)